MNIPYRIALVPRIDWNDCTVLALSSCLNIQYEKAHSLFAEEGRKLGQGVRVDLLGDILRDIGFVLRTELFKLPLEDVVKQCQKGRFIARTKNHAFAIVDGVVIDWSSETVKTKKKIERVYEFKEENSKNQTTSSRS